MMIAGGSRAVQSSVVELRGERRHAKYPNLGSEESVESWSSRRYLRPPISWICTSGRVPSRESPTLFYIEVMECYEKERKSNERGMSTTSCTIHGSVF
jgi:hypothetical protein